jgi:SAM-dependent methyltransferase
MSEQDGPNGTARVHFATDYDQYAPTYAWARWAVPWVLDPLEKLLGGWPANAAVLEIGCGTGNYIRALADSRSALFFVGLDLSQAMLEEAQKAGSRVSYVLGNAARHLPYRDGTFAVAFAVDVIHHIDDTSRFFTEACRVLAPGGRLTIVTDSAETMARRSLTAFFPELLPIELARYSALPLLHQEAAGAGLELQSHERVSGEVPLSDEFLLRLDAKCSSAMRLISDSEHAAGMARVRAAQARGESWISCYDVIHYRRSERSA